MNLKENQFYLSIWGKERGIKGGEKRVKEDKGKEEKKAKEISACLAIVPCIHLPGLHDPFQSMSEFSFSTKFWEEIVLSFLILGIFSFEPLAEVSVSEDPSSVPQLRFY